MIIRITTRRAVLALAVAFLYVALSPATPAAADREHQQIMADPRMLQEQTNQLQALMSDLGEALKAVNSRLDDQTSLERKSFADGKVQMDSISSDLRVVREKVDETNVRLGSISHELESLRQAIPEPGAIPPLAPVTDPTAAAAALGVAPADSPATPPTAAIGPVAANPPVSPQSPQRLWDSSWADYTSGNYSLAVTGFQYYLSAFPKGPRAHEAQLLIGEALTLDKKLVEAIEAYDRVIATYPSSPSVPQAYYKRGLALQGLGQNDRARESFEIVVKQYPDSAAATLAQQRLESVNKPPAR
jgi:tol-pal system protein YbgF